jgi:ABC-type thiamine transport system ATPase subunit
LRIPFSALDLALRERMLTNVAGHFADLLRSAADMMQTLA